METLMEFREPGKIRHIELLNVTREHMELARKIVPIVSVQNRYSFADREWDYVVTTVRRMVSPSSPGLPQDPAGVRPFQVALVWLPKRLLKVQLSG